jgi:hypothetical protein
MDRDDTIISEMRKRPRGTWSADERDQYYRELRWQRIMKLVERFGWAVLVAVSALLEIPMPWHGG